VEKWVAEFYISLTAHLGIIPVNNQLDALFQCIYLFHFSTFFEQPSAHHQENQLYQYIIWYISLCVGDCLVCRYTGIPGSRLKSNNNFQKVHTAYTTAPHNHSQHNQTSSHEVLTSLVLVLLMMGIMMP
jgi:hypothetical protein